MPITLSGLFRSLLTVSALYAQNGRPKPPFEELQGLTGTAYADCECGYAVNSTTKTGYQVWTDLIETNFLTNRDIRANTDWKVQKYYTEPKDGHIGRNCTAENVISNPVVDNSSLAGSSQLGGDAGLQLWVRGGIPSNDLVPSGEIKTARNDMLYGSFRTAIKLTPVNGTCSALFTYYNDSQEIDIELLSRQYANYSIDDPPSVPSSPLNLVLHSAAALEAGFQTPNTSTYGRPVIPVNLTNAFHEYRFDWTPSHVSFYFDGRWLWDLEDSNVPVMPSALLINHWSNGALGWSQGPPMVDAVMTISYFKAYFNSSDPQRQHDYQGRCRDPASNNAICEVPDQNGAPNGTSDGATGGANTFFFSAQSNQTVNQTVYDGEEDGASLIRAHLWGWCFWIILCGMIPNFL